MTCLRFRIYWLRSRDLQGAGTGTGTGTDGVFRQVFVELVGSLGEDEPIGYVVVGGVVLLMVFLLLFVVIVVVVVVLVVVVVVVVVVVIVVVAAAAVAVSVPAVCGVLGLRQRPHLICGRQSDCNVGGVYTYSMVENTDQPTSNIYTSRTAQPKRSHRTFQVPVIMVIMISSYVA